MKKIKHIDNPCGKRMATPIENWYEIRVNYEKVAAFGPIRQEALDRAWDLIRKVRYDLYRGKVFQIVEGLKVQTKNEKGQYSFTRNGLRETIIHEEHPTQFEEPTPKGCVSPIPYDLSIL